MYTRQLLKRGGSTNDPSSTDNTGSSPTTPAYSSKQPPSSHFGSKRLAWRRVHRVLAMQWRSIVLSLLIIIECVYFGAVYVAQVRVSKDAAQPQHIAQLEKWVLCLVGSVGDKDKCLPLAAPLGIGEEVVVASLFIAAVSCVLLCVACLLGFLFFVVGEAGANACVGA